MAGKKKKCSSYKAFEQHSRRASGFVRFFDEGIFDETAQGRSKGQPRREEAELLRAAVVFSVGSFDAFLSDVVVEIVPVSGGDPKGLREPMREIAKSDVGLALRLAVQSDSDRTAVFREALSDWLDTRSFHGPTAVDRVCAYLGIDIAMTGRERGDLAKFTNHRHRVVHKGKKPRIKRKDAKDCISLTRELARRINYAAVAAYH